MELPSRPPDLCSTEDVLCPVLEEGLVVAYALMEDVLAQRDPKDVARQRDHILANLLERLGRVEGGEGEVDGEQGREGRFGQVGEGRDWTA